MAAKKKALPRLTLEQIREVQDIKEEAVEVPEWGASVVVRGVSKVVFDQWLTMDAPDDAAFLLSESLVDPKVTQEEAAELRGKSAAALSRIEAAVMRLSSAEGAEARFLVGNGS